MFKSCKDGVHKFEARYSYIPYEKKLEAVLVTHSELFNQKVYVHDICTKCGKIIKEIK